MNKNKPATISAIFIILCFVVAAIIVIQVFRIISFSPKNNTFPLEVNRIEVIIPGKGYNVKTENKYIAPISGTVNRIKKAGAVVRNGSPMVSINSGKTNSELSSQQIGILSYICDGLEATYTIENALNGNLTPKEITDPSTQFERVENEKKVKEGDFICKVVGNESISYVLLINPLFANKFSVGDSATFSLTYPSSMSVSGTITHIQPIDENNLLIIFKTPYYIDVLLNTRNIKGYFTFGFHTAALIPHDAVKEISPGNYALYYVPNKEDKPVFTSVNVLGIQPGTNYYIVTSFGSEKSEKKIEACRGVQVCNSWKAIEKEIMKNE